MKQLDNNNKVHKKVHNYCNAPKMANYIEEAVQLIYLLKDIMSRQ